VKKIDPDKVYIIIFAFFVASAGIRYGGELIHSVVAEPVALVEHAR
jgi:hypothetical protein